MSKTPWEIIPANPLEDYPYYQVIGSCGGSKNQEDCGIFCGYYPHYKWTSAEGTGDLVSRSLIVPQIRTWFSKKNKIKFQDLKGGWGDYQVKYWWRVPNCGHEVYASIPHMRGKFGWPIVKTVGPESEFFSLPETVVYPGYRTENCEVCIKIREFSCDHCGHKWQASTPIKQSDKTCIPCKEERNKQATLIREELKKKNAKPKKPRAYELCETQYLYRYFDAEDNLLYVGITVDVAKRARGHQKSSNWWNLQVKVTTEVYKSRKEVIEAERLAILRETPRYNVAGVPQEVLASRKQLV